MVVRIYGPRDRAPRGMLVINTTSRSSDWGRDLSPFLLGPCRLYDKMKSRTMENAWQYCKVYPQHCGEDGEPTMDYWEWARAGWASSLANRYPMGKGARPLYSLWKGKHLDYVAARKKIYIPLYAKCVRATAFVWRKLKKLYRTGEDFGLWDFDGYDHHRRGLTLEQVRDNPHDKMGHAFVLAMMLEGLV